MTILSNCVYEMSKGTGAMCWRTCCIKLKQIKATFPRCRLLALKDSAALSICSSCFTFHFSPAAQLNLNIIDTGSLSYLLRGVNVAVTAASWKLWLC